MYSRPVNSSEPGPHVIHANFSPVLLAGLIIRPLPKAPLNLLLKYITNQVQDNHPAIFDRLDPLNGTHFLIRPTDLSHDIRLIIGDGLVECEIEDEFMRPVDVTITGPFMSLMDMLQGKIDGDALFFSRRLTVEGNTEALLTLRNAMDSDDIDLRAEILTSLGPLKTPAEGLLKLGDQLFHHLANDMNVLSQALTKPLTEHCDALEQDQQLLHGKITHLEKILHKTQNRLQSLGRKVTAGPENKS